MKSNIRYLSLAVAALVTSTDAALVHYYSTETGDITQDLVGSADGTLYGAASLSGSGALVTDGSGGGLSGGTPTQGMQLAASAVSGITGSFTISTWLQSAGNAYKSWLFAFNDGSSANQIASLAVDGGAPYPPHTYTGISGSYTDIWGTGYDNGAGGSWTDDGVLHQQVLTYDGATLTLYLDTQLAGSAAVAGLDLSTLTNVTVAGGSPWAVGDRSFNGTTSAFGIWDSAMSASEVSNLYGFGNTATVAQLVPEPSAALLGGLGMLGLLRRRRM